MSFSVWRPGFEGLVQHRDSPTAREAAEEFVRFLDIREDSDIEVFVAYRDHPAAKFIVSVDFTPTIRARPIL